MSPFSNQGRTRSWLLEHACHCSTYWQQAIYDKMNWCDVRCMYVCMNWCMYVSTQQGVSSLSFECRACNKALTVSTQQLNTWTIEYLIWLKSPVAYLMSGMHSQQSSGMNEWMVGCVITGFVTGSMLQGFYCNCCWYQLHSLSTKLQIELYIHHQLMSHTCMYSEHAIGTAVYRTAH